MDDYIKSKERSHADSVTVCVWLCKGFALVVSSGLIYEAVKRLAS